MTTPTTQGAIMTLPPCPIAGHDNPHHFHLRHDDALGQRPATPGHPSQCAHSDEYASRCYSAHVPEPTSDPDEWVRVDVDTMIPEGVDFSKTSTKTWRVHKGHGPVYVRRSDLDAILKPTPTPAEKLAEALSATYAADGDEPAWTPNDVLAALDAAGLALAERGEK